MADAPKPTPADRADAAERFVSAIERAFLAIADAGAVITTDLFPGIEGRLNTNLVKAQEFLGAAHKEAAVQGYDDHRRMQAAERAAELHAELASLDPVMRETIKGAWPAGVPALTRPTFLLAHVPQVRALIDQFASGDGAGVSGLPPAAQGLESEDVDQAAPVAGSEPDAPPITDVKVVHDVMPITQDMAEDIPTDPPLEESDVNADPRELAHQTVRDGLVKRVYQLPEKDRDECRAFLTEEGYDFDKLTIGEVGAVGALLNQWETKTVPKDVAGRAAALAAKAIVDIQRDKPPMRDIVT